jgi:hypothetical protein
MLYGYPLAHSRIHLCGSTIGSFVPHRHGSCLVCPRSGRSRHYSGDSAALAPLGPGYDMRWCCPAWIRYLHSAVASPCWWRLRQLVLAQCKWTRDVFFPCGPCRIRGRNSGHVCYQEDIPGLFCETSQTCIIRMTLQPMLLTRRK